MTPIEALQHLPEHASQHLGHRERQARLGGRPLPRPKVRAAVVEPVVVPIVEQEEEAEPVEVVVLPVPAPKLTIEAIKRAVCQHYGISHNEIISDHRNHRVVRPRQVGMYLSRKLTPRSYPEIGRKFGGRDHGTVISGCRRVVRLIEANPDFASDVAAIEEFLSP